MVFVLYYICGSVHTVQLTWNSLYTVLTKIDISLKEQLNESPVISELFNEFELILFLGKNSRI